jgi:hypothetical protein
MKTASDYREQASKARELEKAAPDARMREVIGRMAEAWEDLAAERERQVLEQKVDSPG